MASPILIYPLEQYWSQLRDGTRDQIIGGIVVLIIGAIATAIWRFLRRRGKEVVDPQPASVQPTQQEVVVKFEAAQPVPPREILPDSIATSRRSAIPRPPLAGFVARRDENGRDIVERLKDELLPEKEQLIVLWGAGGVGKTTLAAETARAMREIFTGGIVWTSADGKPDFALSTLLDEIATQLGRADVRQLAPDPKDEAVHHLLSTAPATLIVLDNFETISSSEQEKCAQWLANRASCPALITSRYQVVNARPVRILAMSLPEAREFLQRLTSELGNPNTFDNLDPEQIIHAADRIPRVLEWVVRQIELARQPQIVLDELSHGKGDAARRVFDRSFDLPQLGNDGRVTLLALSFFVPDASRIALAQVAGFGEDLARLDLAVQQLVELWLIKATGGNERLKVEGLTRELAKARREKDQREAVYQPRFVNYFLEYGTAHEQPKVDDYQALETEKDNLLSAIEMAVELEDWESVKAFAYALALPSKGWLHVYGYWTDALRTNEHALEASRRTASRQERAVLAHNVAMICVDIGERDKARMLCNESLEIDRDLGNQPGVATSLHLLAIMARQNGDTEEAYRLCNESLEIKRTIGDPASIEKSIHLLAMIAYTRGDFDEARQLYNESLKIGRELGESDRIARILHNLGTLAHAEGKLIDARKLYEESFQLTRESGNQYHLAMTLGALGHLTEDEENWSEAERLYKEALDIFERLKSADAEIVREALRRLKEPHR